jgi:hypothetical protein
VASRRYTRSGEARDGDVTEAEPEVGVTALDEAGYGLLVSGEPESRTCVCASTKLGHVADRRTPDESTHWDDMPGTCTRAEIEVGRSAIPPASMIAQRRKEVMRGARRLLCQTGRCPGSAWKKELSSD